MPKHKILIVDSDAASRNFVARKLQEQKFDILQAGSAKEGLIFTWRDHPDLVIADPALPDLTGEEFAAKLRNDSRTEKIPLVALSSDHNPERIKSCREAGFNEYITKSGQAISTLNEVVNRFFGISEEVMKQGGLMIVFMSAKGGTGTSSICANAASNLARQKPEPRVAVADLVLPIGSIASIVGYEGEQTILSLAEKTSDETDPDFLGRELPFMETWQFNLLAGSTDPELSSHLSSGRIWDFVTGLKSAYDYVFIDIGRSLSKITLPLVQHADLLVVIVSTDVSTISLTGNMLEYLGSKGVKKDSIYTILNRHTGPEGLDKRETESTLGVKVNTVIPYLSTNFGFANSQHCPFTIKFPNDTTSIIFYESAQEMVALARKLREG